MKKISFLTLILATIVAFAACIDRNKKQPEPVVTTKKEIASQTTSDNIKVTLYADTALFFAGYNNIYFGLKDASGNAISNATITMSPLMVMTSMTHTCGFEQLQYSPTEKLYQGSSTFGMPTTADGKWKIDVTVNGKKVSFPITVNTFPTKILSRDVGTDNATYFIALVRPKSWKVGINDIEFVVYKKETMMSFPAVLDATIEMTPEMPSMGHGSPNNVNPVHIGKGHYKGKVNFTMTGDWRMKLVLKRNGTTVVGNAFVDVLF